MPRADGLWPVVRDNFSANDDVNSNGTPRGPPRIAVEDMPDEAADSAAAKRDEILADDGTTDIDGSDANDNTIA